MAVSDLASLKRTLLRVMIVALCVTALVAIAAVLSASFDRTEAQVLLTHLAVAVYSLFALSMAAVSERRPRLAAVGWAACGLGLALALLTIWVDWSEDRVNLYRWMLIMLAASFTLAHVALIEARRRASDGPVVRSIATATTVLAAFVGALIALGLSADQAVSEGYFRLLGVVGVLDLLGTLVLPIARKIEQPRAGAPAADR
jgi:hypothetical protein